MGVSWAAKPQSSPLSRKKCDKPVELRYVSPPARVGQGSRGVAQLVERRSPKPKAGGSRPSAPASYCYPLCMCDFSREGSRRRREVDNQAAGGRAFLRPQDHGQMKNPLDLHPRGASGSIEGHVADLERGLDHDGHGARHGDPHIDLLPGRRSDHRLRRSFHSRVRRTDPRLTRDGSSTEGERLKHGEALVHRARLLELREEGGGCHQGPREDCRPLGSVRGGAGADRGRGRGAARAQGAGRAQVLSRLRAGQDGDDGCRLSPDQEHAEGDGLPRRRQQGDADHARTRPSASSTRSRKVWSGPSP